MRKIRKQNLSKKIIYIIIVLMLCNFIIPSYSYASDGGPLFDVLMKFVTFLCDSVMQFMQNTFTSNASISNGNGTYTYQYSPAIIFSGTVMGLDINFIKPNTDERNTNNYEAFLRAKIETEYRDSATKVSSDEIKEIAKSGFIWWEYYDNKYSGYKSVSGNGIGLENATDRYHIYYLEQNGKLYVYFYYWDMISVDRDELLYFSPTPYTINEEFIKQMNATTTYTSIAYELQPTIATWYNALRRIAIVGLLSVLLYVGIRILLTSIAGKENSKYKKMLIDWLTALCLLFTIHYIMNLILVVTKQLSAIFNSGLEDPLLNGLRADIESGGSWGSVLAEVIMYIVLTIYTITFTFQYLKRVLYMAFFTLISPLVTLTYPLDKIKDGKAQAFSMWLREYIFTALIQVVHLIVYYVMVESALSLVDKYPIYAIVAIGFMTQAEKIIRSMFGFNNADTVGTIGAAATGALVANAMNKLKSLSKAPKGGKGGESGGSSNNNVRTASKDPLSAVKENQGKKENGTSDSKTTGKENANTQGDESKTVKPERSIKGGAKSLLGKYHRKIGGAALGTFLGGAGAMIGFAAGVSQGDMGAALGGALAGGKAGYALGGRAYNGVFDTPGNIRKAINNIGDTWNEGAFGEEYANNTKFDREFRRSSTYKALKSNPNFSDDSVQAMLDAGITERGAMEKILNSGGDVETQIGYYALSQLCENSIYYDDAKLKKFLGEHGMGEISNLDDIRNKMRAYR